MSYEKTKAEIENRKAQFAPDVFKYLELTGRSQKGRSYFGKLACGNPNLVACLERGKLPSYEVMLLVWSYMKEIPPPEAAKDVVAAGSGE